MSHSSAADEGNESVCSQNSTEDDQEINRGLGPVVKVVICYVSPHGWFGACELAAHSVVLVEDDCSSRRRCLNSAVCSS